MHRTRAGSEYDLVTEISFSRGYPGKLIKQGKKTEMPSLTSEKCPADRFGPSV